MLPLNVLQFEELNVLHLNQALENRQHLFLWFRWLARLSVFLNGIVVLTTYFMPLAS